MSHVRGDEMGVFIRVSKHCCVSLFVVIPVQVQSPASSAAFESGVEAGGLLLNLNQSPLKFGVVPFSFPLNSIL